MEPHTIKEEGDIILQDPTVSWHFAETVAVSTREHRQIFALRMACSAIIVKISGISTVSAFRDSDRGKGKIRTNIKIRVRGVKDPSDNEMVDLPFLEILKILEILGAQGRDLKMYSIFKILGQILMQILLL